MAAGNRCQVAHVTWGMKSSLTKYAAPVLLAGLIALSGCSSNGSDSSNSSEQTHSAADVSGEPEGTPGRSSGSSYESAPGSGKANRAAPRTQAVISTGTISLRSDDVDQARFDLGKALDAHKATISEENASADDDGTMRRARLVVRVPVAEFSDAMSDLGEVGELTNSSRGTEDVTTQVIDNDVRIRAQEKSLRRVEILLSRAESIGDIVSIEAQLTSRQAELDSLKSQQAYLKDQTSLSTITITLERGSTAVEEKPESEHNAFVAGLLGGWNALAGLGAGAATVFGALLPFTVLVLLLGVPALLALRRLRPRQRWAGPDAAPGTD